MIAGGGGYIGGRLVQTLAEEGWDVHAVVREPTPWLEVEQTVVDLAAEEAPTVLLSACQGADTVVHLAGENEVLAAQRPAEALAATMVATERVSEACAAAATKRLVYMSTVHVYGARIAPGAVLTEDIRAEPRSAYAISRLASEHVAAALAAQAYEFIVFRLTNAVGAPYDPRVDRWTLVANDLCRQGSLQGRLELRSSGAQWRDFVPLTAVCSAIAGASRIDGSVLPPGTYNLGSGQPMTVRALAQMIQDGFEQETGRRPDLHAPEPEDDPAGPYYVSIERAAQHGLRVQGRLDDAVLETVRFCLDHRAELG